MILFFSEQILDFKIYNIGLFFNAIRMKRILIITLLFACMMIACKNKKHEIVIIPDYAKNHLQKNHLSGNVKEIRTVSYYQYDSTTFHHAK